ncbi:hypothetical protein EYF80_004667 [Liparis tanakae]|uniref:Uncharacterized protein n=1 Tax=Liparis tanakae TaxID=230148 RepID=A0A4Z2J642_9TELE|nr:hypothetical protein EYF80_004667 [Liparis tanakae]
MEVMTQRGGHLDTSREETTNTHTHKPGLCVKPGDEGINPILTGLSCGVFVKEGVRSWEANR